MQLQTSQPKDWIEAFKAQAERHGQTVSEWIGECCLANLDRDLRKNLVKRPPAHRPRKDDK